MSLKPIIEEEMRRVAVDQKKPLAPLTDDLPLLDTGLDSLGFALVVAGLEDRLGQDPFATTEDVAFPVTFGDFVAFYDRAAARPA